MRVRLAGALGVAGLAAAGWWRLDAVLPDVRSGVFPNGMEYLRSGAGPKTLLVLIGSPLRGAPPNRLVQRTAGLV